MYPDTDLPPIVLGSDLLESVNREVSAPWDAIRRYEEMGLDRRRSWNILLSSEEEKKAFDTLEKRFGAPFSYHMVFEARKGMLRKGKKVPLDEMTRIAEKSDKKGLKSWLYSL